MRFIHLIVKTYTNEMSIQGIDSSIFESLLLLLVYSHGHQHHPYEKDPKIVEEWNVDDDFVEAMEEAVTSVSPTDDSSSKENKKKKPSIAPAPISSLFRFASTQDLVVLGLGVFFCILSSFTMPAINIIFGSVIDSIAEPINVQELVNTSVRGMIGLGIYGFITFTVSFWLCGKAAASVANGYRMHYVEALLQQDMSFFDNAEPGSLTLMLSDSAMTIQMGLSDKFAQGVQGIFQFIFGFAIAFSFGPILSLVLMACVPFLCAVTVAMFMWGSEDGIFGKEAYEQAATISNETISNIRTVISLNAEPMVRDGDRRRISFCKPAFLTKRFFIL